MNQLFPGQNPDEKVLVLARAHWLTLLPTLLIVGILALLPLGVAALIPVAGLEIEGTGNAGAVAILSAYYLTLVTFFYIRWLDYYLDVAIVTDKRVVDVDQNGLFRRDVDELDSKMIQDVSSSRQGILQTVFNFGNVMIQTAGERRNFEFKGVPDPDAVQRAVAESQGMGESAEHKEAAAAEVAEKTAEKVAEKVAEHTSTPSPPPTPEKASPTPTPEKPPTDSPDLPQERE